jgi:signal peptidase I
LTASPKKFWKNDYVQTAAIIGLIILIFFGLWYGATIALNNPNPIVVVPSPSMSIPANGVFDGWSYPFDRTLQVGDLLILQGVNPKDLNTNYPNSDIIVFHEAADPAKLIVHRIATAQEINRTLYFHTKGDGNPPIKWPNAISPENYDGMPIEPQEGVSQDKIIGRVIFRIPWIGNLVLLIQKPEGIIAIGIIVALLIIIEFVAPILKKKTTPTMEPTKSESSNNNF